MELRGQRFVVLLVGATLATASINLEVKIGEHLQHFSDVRFPDIKHTDSWLEAREYIKNQFEKYGLAVELQAFTTTVITGEGDESQVEGTNIIGIAKPPTNRAGSVMVVGADYDTNAHGEPGPLFNNGAGVGALLETARLFMSNAGQEGELMMKHTTVFVAFDLNTKEHDSGPGKPGGWYFVNEWLWEYVNQSDTRFGGAFVLDSLMNVNQNPNSQDVHEDFRRMFQDTYTRIVQSHHKGNFLGVVTLPEEKAVELKDQFTGNYNKLRMAETFRVEDMTLPDNTSMSELFSELTTQDTVHFWSFTANGKMTPLPAVLITDTENLRHAPTTSCESVDCPTENWLTAERQDFLVSTVKALTDTLLERQARQLTDLENHLTHFEDPRNPQVADRGPYERARAYIKDKFAEFGLETHAQNFETVISGQGGDVVVPGENIIGVAEGAAVGGPVLVVGADYDTGVHNSPLEDNGAGVTALLEVARLFMQQTAVVGGSFEQLSSVIFVAFDLNAKEYGSSQTGKQGAYHFLRHWLWDHVNQSTVNFGGAFILDSIAKYSEVDSSQHVFEEFVTAFPDASRDIDKHNNKGNFLAVFTREDETSTQLAKAFSDNYEKDRRARFVRLQDFTVRSGLSYTGVFEMFNHQSHFPFWSFTPDEDLVPLPAVLLTDTDVYRNTEDPCPRPCSSVEFLTRRRRAVITNIVDSVTSTLLQLQTKRAERPTAAPITGNGGERSRSTSLALTTFVFSLVFVLQ
ncbi:uncharacterized protein LOC134775233 isoform X2 [Penaeus indicus]|uniref:uncharacterized protein LOC134775233 isoform X2 n=1 Tax=Penaeus indicus TaxID=29960 RepID=UPI00300D0D46